MKNSSEHLRNRALDTRISAYYDQNYWIWQKSIGAIGGWANRHKFQSSVSPNDLVIDFGCGGGYLLANLECGTRIGIEPNESARAQLFEFGITHFRTTDEAMNRLGTGIADVVISNHALEHVLNPLHELRHLWLLLKPGGKILFYVPCDSFRRRYRETDSNRHLFSWSPSNLGNLFAEAGFRVDVARPYLYKWPPGYQSLARLGRPIFHLACHLWGRLERSWVQVEILATK